MGYSGIIGKVNSGGAKFGERMTIGKTPMSGSRRLSAWLSSEHKSGLKNFHGNTQFQINSVLNMLILLKMLCLNKYTSVGGLNAVVICLEHLRKNGKSNLNIACTQHAVVRCRLPEMQGLRGAGLCPAGMIPHPNRGTGCI